MRGLADSSTAATPRRPLQRVVESERDLDDGVRSALGPRGALRRLADAPAKKESEVEVGVLEIATTCRLLPISAASPTPSRPATSSVATRRRQEGVRRKWKVQGAGLRSHLSETRDSCHR